MYRKQIAFVRDRHAALSLSFSRFYVDFIIIILIFESQCVCVVRFCAFFTFKIFVAGCRHTLRLGVIMFCVFVSVCVCVVWSCDGDDNGILYFPDAPQCASKLIRATAI